MASMDAILAWAIPVPVDQLGAHLEAYARLLPVINILRLCNRFGQGDRAIVTQLPAELVEIIEGYMIQSERSKHEEEWSKAFNCWKNVCDPTDHFYMEECVELFEREGLADGQDLAIDANDRAELTEAELETLNNAFWLTWMECEFVNGDIEFSTASESGGGDGYDPEDEMQCELLERHGKTKYDWTRKISNLEGQEHPNTLSWGKLMSEHFGLDIHVSHVQANSEDNASTSAYIFLPGSLDVGVERGLPVQTLDSQRETGASVPERPPTASTCADLNSGNVPGEKSTPPQHLETGKAVAWRDETSTQLSNKDMYRFTRALEILGLQPLPAHENIKQGSSALRENTEAEMTNQDLATTGDVPKPKLIFMMRVDEQPWWDVEE